MIPYSKQTITSQDIKEVSKALRSDFLTTGPRVASFENQCVKEFGSRYSVSFNSATSALHIACLALGLGKGDLAWTSSMSFVASSNCALYCGAKIDLVDINKDNFNICTKALEEKLITAKKRGKLPKVLIVVHFAGLACEMSSIRKLSKHYGFKVIEDASHAVGSRYKNSKIGDCKYSDITVFSFHPVKIFTTGEGGLALTNKKTSYEKMSSLRAHGIVRKENKFESIQHNKNKPWFYEQQELGFNYRMTDIAAALGSSQIKKYRKWNEKRNELAQSYIKAFDEIDTIKYQTFDSAKYYSSYHLFVIQINNRDEIFRKMQEKGIGVNVHYIPIHHHPYYKRLNLKGNFINADNYYQKALTIPLFPQLTQKQQAYIISTLKKLVKE